MIKEREILELNLPLLRLLTGHEFDECVRGNVTSILLLPLGPQYLMNPSVITLMNCSVTSLTSHLLSVRRLTSRCNQCVLSQGTIIVDDHDP